MSSETLGFWDGVRTYTNAWMHRNDEINDIEIFEGRLILHIGDKAFKEGAGDGPRKVAEFASNLLYVSGGGLGGGAVASLASGHPVFKVLGGLIGAAKGEYDYEKKVKPLIEEYFPNQENLLKRQYLGAINAASELAENVLFNNQLSDEEKVDQLKSYSEHCSMLSTQFEKSYPIVAKALIDSKENLDYEISKLSEYLSVEKSGPTPGPDSKRAKISNLIDQFEFPKSPSPPNPDSPPNPKAPPRPKGLGSKKVTRVIKPNPKGEKEAQKLLDGHGVKYSTLSKKTQFFLSEMATHYRQERRLMSPEEAFEFLGNASTLTAMIGQFSGKNEIVKIGQYGGKVIEEMKNIGKLSKELISAPLGLATLNPVMGIATAVLSVASLFRKRKQENALDPIKQELQAISGKIEALHRDMLQGFNMLAMGQMHIYKELVSGFNHLNKLITYYHHETVVPMMICFERMEERLILLQQELSARFNISDLRGFDIIVDSVEKANSSLYEEKDREQVIRDLKRLRLSELEYWIQKEAKSAHFNGHFYFHLTQTSSVKNAHLLVMNTLMHDGNPEQISYFIAFLGKIAQQLIPSHDFSSLELTQLINPDIWTKGVHAYIILREKFHDYDISYDIQNLIFQDILNMGSDYLKFIKALQGNQRVLFNKLLEIHKSNILQLKEKVTSKVVTEYTDDKLKLLNREEIKKQLEYSYDEGQIRKYVNNVVVTPILQHCEMYKSFIKTEMQTIEAKWSENLSHLIDKMTQGVTRIEDLYPYFDRPSCPFARHKKGTAKGESYLEVYHAICHFSHFEDYGFKISLSLRNLFDQDEALRRTIPNIYYLAEGLGIGHFEISFITHYVNNNSNFVDAAHTELNGGAFYNYKYEFQVSFVFDGGDHGRIKICDFDCHTDQIPISQTVREGAKVCLTNRQRMNILGPHGHPTPPLEYWILGVCNNKLNTFHQVRYFHKANRITRGTISTQLEQNLRQAIDVKMNEIRSNHNVHFEEKHKKVSLNNEFDKINFSRNLILSYMYLLGFDQRYIEEAKDLFSSQTLEESSKDEQSDLQNELLSLFQIDQEKVFSKRKIKENMDKIVLNRFLEANQQAIQKLQKLTATTNIEALIGYQVNEVQLIVEMINAFSVLSPDAT